MMKNVFFRFREHPGDLLRGTSTIQLPDPEKDLDTFLVQFLPLYQTDNTVAYLNDLYKLYYDDFQDEEDLLEFIKYIGGEKTKDELKSEIDNIEKELINEAYENFYRLILENKIEIITDGEK
ncbi:hypothetical protein OF897_13450 [Chryseobacterium formosus]|uniref:Uncharacterized protein n=1 Tax=Chryseobacterium formosus TaxID=1537363 RepID=A0ABT3XU51_9FLAO|nr:hypothetical protein [Chryseobacterium formosus]MCX8524919.1 hypothetical protein [Chryseobacterium formosus]